jgi:hypothetical protein
MLDDSARAQAAHDAMRKYNLENLSRLPKTKRSPIVPAWNLEAPRRMNIECNDCGVSLWIDDPASV